jgi:hypothetical protein
MDVCKVTFMDPYSLTEGEMKTVKRFVRQGKTFAVDGR